MNDNIKNTINSIFSEYKLQSDEYFNKIDGLVYCSKCNTPRQIKIKILGRTATPFVMCKCLKEKHDKEQEEIKKREFLNHIARMKSVGLQDKALREYNFKNDRGYNPEITKAYDYVNNWDRLKVLSMGLLLWGDTGTGKSFFAGCIANALIEKGVPVLMTNFSRILNTLTGMFSEDRNEFIDSLNQYSLLIIDDLGIERNSEFALEQIYSVIDSRYRSKKPFIVTTNLTLEELKNPADIAHQRIYDRILERCIPLKINNYNIRKINASANIKEAKKIFMGGKVND